jgi:hypothetical protein
MIAFIDAHRGQFGVGLICRTLRAAITGFGSADPQLEGLHGTETLDH